RGMVRWSKHAIAGGRLNLSSSNLAGPLACVARACVAIVLGASILPAARAGGDDCRVGSYVLDDGSHVDVGPGNDDHLRWRREDGTTGELTRGANDTWTSTLGWTGRDDGRRVDFECDAGRITFAGVPGRRVALETTETMFDGAGVRLAGRL